MISRRATLAAIALSATLAGSLAQAAERAAYTQVAFDAAQKAGKPIFVEVHAPWCPTCAAQKPILSKLESDPRYAGLKIFRVDFDTQKDALKRFNAQKQSTLISFKGAAETGRSVGDTNEASIAALLAKTL